MTIELSREIGIAFVAALRKAKRNELADTIEARLSVYGRADSVEVSDNRMQDFDMDTEPEDDGEAYAYFMCCICCGAKGGWAKSPTSAPRNWEMRTSAEQAELWRLERVARGWEKEQQEWETKFSFR